MGKSVAQERREVFYPDPMYKNLLEALSLKTGEAKSSIANRALRDLLDKIPQNERQKMLEAVKNKNC